MKYIDLTGQKFARLLVINRAPNRKNSRAMFNCICDCGNKTCVGSYHLRSGEVRSCGCLRTDERKDDHSLCRKPGEVGFTYLYGNYKSRAKRGNLCFELTKKEFAKLTKMNCHYCGNPPSIICKRPSHKDYSEFLSKRSGYVYNGIDRLDNTKGYILDNSVSCCKTCNYGKHTLSIKEWEEWINRFVDFQNNKRKS